MARCSSCGGWSSGGSTRASAASARSPYAVSAESVRKRVSWSLNVEVFCVVRRLRVGQQFHAQFGLFQGALTIALERDAAFERLERIVQALVALFHAFDEF